MDIVQLAGELPALHAVDTVVIAATTTITVTGHTCPHPTPLLGAAEAAAEVVLEVGEPLNHAGQVQVRLFFIHMQRC